MSKSVFGSAILLLAFLLVTFQINSVASLYDRCLDTYVRRRDLKPRVVQLGNGNFTIVADIPVLIDGGVSISWQRPSNWRRIFRPPRLQYSSMTIDNIPTALTTWVPKRRWLKMWKIKNYWDVDSENMFYLDNGTLDSIYKFFKNMINNTQPYICETICIYMYMYTYRLVDIHEFNKRRMLDQSYNASRFNGHIPHLEKVKW